MKQTIKITRTETLVVERQVVEPTGTAGILHEANSGKCGQALVGTVVSHSVTDWRVGASSVDDGLPAAPAKRRRK